MSNFKPIAMRCTQEQFEAVKPKLENCEIKYIEDFTYCNYLVNSLAGKNYVVSNICELVKREHDREVHEEWNERIFLEACGVEIETLQDRLANLEKEIEEVKALIEEENKPKIGDWCKFWDDDKSIFIVGKLTHIADTVIHPYYIHRMTFKNCDVITDENFLKAFNNL